MYRSKGLLGIRDTSLFLRYIDLPFHLQTNKLMSCYRLRYSLPINVYLITYVLKFLKKTRYPIHCNLRLSPIENRGTNTLALREILGHILVFAEAVLNAEDDPVRMKPLQSTWLNLVHVYPRLFPTMWCWGYSDLWNSCKTESLGCTFDWWLLMIYVLLQFIWWSFEVISIEGGFFLTRVYHVHSALY